MQLAITNCKFFINNELVNNKAILVDDGIITGIIPNTEIPSQYQKGLLNNNYITPGFIDIQVYGAGGKLFSAYPQPDTLQLMEDTFLKQGTTGFLATIATSSDEIIKKGIQAAKDFVIKGHRNFWGLHLEGPFIHPDRRGAHVAQHVRKATLQNIKQIIDHAEGVVRIITLAPELQDDDVLRYLNSKNIIISAGHSNATYNEATAAFNKGVSLATHLFNAMPAIHHRNPGLIGAIYNHKSVMSSIVADGIHVDFAALQFSKAIMKDRLFLITDAVTETGIGDYQHQKEGSKYTTKDGTLSGSSLTMMSAVKNCVQHAGIPLAEALRMASQYPAKALGAGNTFGKIEKGYKANFTVFTNELNAAGSIVNEKLYQ